MRVVGFYGRSDDCEELMGLLIGDQGIGLGESNTYHQLVDLNRKVVIK